jgi:hypothetical protein
MKAKSVIGVLIGIVAILVILIFISRYSEYLFGSNDYEAELLEFKQQVRNDLKNFNMIKRIKDNRGIVKPRDDFTTIEQLSVYQTYVTPNHPAITGYISSEGLTGVVDAYNTAVDWTWVSDITLHGVSENWLKPKEFIQDTPNKTLYPNNPVDGIASDCESQAYTLVSLIEALGVSKDNVRVVIGLVDFSGTTGGHAWVQVYFEGQWYELEATSGPYWDDDENKLVPSDGVNIDYFKTHPYPAEEYWAFFNDIYYYNPTNGVKSSNLPSHWLQTEKTFKLSQLRAANRN